MNGQTLSWSQDDFYTELVAVRNQVDKLINKVLSLNPAKGGAAWWKKMDEEGLEQIKRGEVVKFETTKELKKHLGL